MTPYFRIKDAAQKNIGDAGDRDPGRIVRKTETDDSIVIAGNLLCINVSPVFGSSYLVVYRIENSLQGGRARRGTIFCFTWAGCEGKLANLPEISHYRASPPLQAVSLPAGC